ncbi:hypothetical protein SDC9_196741 [bioreactor metagenome]|uniref:Uncharacterized protein n=1 Tax=bioreactor metagenome TaxID=1076179 RepID=A0A645ICU2_9ZZZZ
MGYLDRMVQYILAVAGSKTQPAQKLHDLGMQAMNAGFEGRPFALGLDGCFHFLFRTLHHFLNAGGMDTPVHNQFFKGKPCDFSSDRIKTGHGDGFRRIVYNQINTGQCFQSSYISSFSADNSALHFIVWQVDY